MLIERAGAAVARAATRMMGGTYGRRVVVLAGKGNNGNDGRAAARRLARAGAAVRVVDVADAPARLPAADLVIDAAFGTGFHGSWTAPDVGDAAVLAVDIPSGVDGATGAAGDGVLPADRTVTFAALKPGLLLPPGSVATGEIELADIGLDVSRAQRPPGDRGRRAAVAAAARRRLAQVARRGGHGRRLAGHDRSRPPGDGGRDAGGGRIRPALQPGRRARSRAADGGRQPLAAARLVVRGRPQGPRPLPGPRGGAGAGPGRGHDGGGAGAGRRGIRPDGGRRRRPVRAGLVARRRGRGAEGSPRRHRPHPPRRRVRPAGRPAPGGRPPGCGSCAVRHDRCRRAAQGSGHHRGRAAGRVLISTAGDERLATAGTGDVLSGIVGALLAQQVPAFEAAAIGAWLHGSAGRRGPERGLVASDLPGLIPGVLERL